MMDVEFETFRNSTNFKLGLTVFNHTRFCLPQYFLMCSSCNTLFAIAKLISLYASEQGLYFVKFVKWPSWKYVYVHISGVCN